MALRVAGSSGVRVPPTGETGLAIHHSLYAAGPAESIIPIACGPFPLGPDGSSWEIWSSDSDSSPGSGGGPARRRRSDHRLLLSGGIRVVPQLGRQRELPGEPGLSGL